MRYYTINIIDPETKTKIMQFSSLREDGSNNPGALDVELDIPVYTFDAPTGAAQVKIWGISIQDIGAAFNLNEKTIEIYAGMTKGLPLANPQQNGLLLRGTIQQAFGNWEGELQSLDLIIMADVGSSSLSKNFVLNWKKGTLLADAIKSTLAVALPDYTSTIDINPNLVLNQDEPGYWQSVVQFAQYIKMVSQHIIGGTYQGVRIVLKEKSFDVYDGTTAKEPFPIQFVDLIGQPTWLGLGNLQFKCVMRADIVVGNYISLPRGQATTTAQSYSQFRKKTSFEGNFVIGPLVRHVGHFRQPNGSSWVSIFNAYVP